jgi:hypothetical protein
MYWPQENGSPRARAELFESHVLVAIHALQGTSHLILWEAHLNQLLHLQITSANRGWVVTAAGKHGMYHNGMMNSARNTFSSMPVDALFAKASVQ